METSEQRHESTEEVGAVSMSPSTSLLACPFCGGKAYWCCCTGHKDSRCGRIRCGKCGLEALWTEGDCIEAKAKWNTRNANAPREGRETR